MDDATKVRVLNIYYDHWGIEELRVRKAVYGIDKTISLLMDWYPYPARYNPHSSFHRIYVHWVDLSDLFLSHLAFDVWMDHEYYRGEGRLDAWKNRLCKNLRLEKEEPVRFLYNELGPREVLSVDAIVAL